MDKHFCRVASAAELDAEIRDIFALELVQRSDQMPSTIEVEYSDESVKQASLIPHVTSRGINIIFHKIGG
jgi:hypothetical protein